MASRGKLFPRKKRYLNSHNCSLPPSELGDDVLSEKVANIANTASPSVCSSITPANGNVPVKIEDPANEKFQFATCDNDDDFGNDDDNPQQLLFMSAQSIANIATNSQVLLGFEQKLDIAISERIESENESCALGIPLAICDSSHDAIVSYKSQKEEELGVLVAPRLKIGEHFCGPECVYERLSDVAQPGTSNAHFVRLMRAGIIQNNSSDPNPCDIWICMQGGIYHDCRPHVCKDIQPHDGFDECSKTHVIHGQDVNGTEHMRHMHNSEVSHYSERTRNENNSHAAIWGMADRTDTRSTSASHNAPWKRAERERAIKKKKSIMRQKAKKQHTGDVFEHSSTIVTVADKSRVVQPKLDRVLDMEIISNDNARKSVALDAWAQNITITLADTRSFAHPTFAFSTDMRIAAEKVISAALLNGQSAERQRDIIQSFSNLVMRGWFIVDISRDIESTSNFMRVELSKIIARLDPKLSDTITVSVPPTTSSHEKYFHQLWKVKEPRPSASNIHEADGKIKFSRFNKFKEIGIGTLFVASKGYESSADIMTLGIPRILIDLFATALRRTYGSYGLIQFAEDNKIKILKKDPYLQKSLEPILSKKTYSRSLNTCNTPVQLRISRIDSGSTAILSRLSALVEWSKMKILYDFFILGLPIDIAIKNFNERNTTFAMN